MPGSVRDVPPAVVLIDKPGGMTSHDVVARARRALGTRKIGHAGTLDPMATGLLVLGVGGATRLLTYVVGLDKTYEATIRLGASTTTDDAEGETTTATDASGIADDDVRSGIRALTGEISQVPSTVSAIKIDGRRAYDLARQGAEVALKARTVTISRFEVRGIQRRESFVDVDVVVDCSSGTYIRALARDLGGTLGVGGHLTALRRTRIGPFAVADAAGVDAIAEAEPLSPARAAGLILPVLEVDAASARDLRQGKRLRGAAPDLPGDPAAAIDELGELVGIVGRKGDDVRSITNMPEPVA